MKAQGNKKILGTWGSKPTVIFLTIILILAAGCLYFFFGAVKPLSLPKASDIETRIDVAPGIYHIGDIIPVTLKVEARTGIRFEMPDLSNVGLGRLEILSKGNLISQKPSGGIRQTISYQLTAWDPGKYTLKSFNMTYWTREGIQKVYSVPSSFLNIKSLLPAGKTQQELAALSIRDVKKPLGMPPRYSIIWWFLGILIIGGIVFLAIQYIKELLNKKNHVLNNQTQTFTFSEAAHIIALRRLAELERKDYLDQQAFKPYYTELAECIREYLENRFQIKALEMTTEEFLESLTMDRTLSKAHQQILTDFLQSADLVKFAKCLPLPAEAERSMSLTKQLIEETREQPLSPNETAVENVNLSSQEI